MSAEITNADEKSGDDDVVAVDAIRSALKGASTTLELARCHESELEAWELFSSNQLKHYYTIFESNNTSSSTTSSTNGKKKIKKTTQEIIVPIKNQQNTYNVASNDNVHVVSTLPILPNGIVDAWKGLASTIPVESVVSSHHESTTNDASFIAIPVAGSISKAILTTCLGRSIQQMSMNASRIIQERQKDGQQLLKRSHEELNQHKKNHPTNYTQVWLQVMDERLRDIREYHAKNESQETAIVFSQQRNVSTTNVVSDTLTNPTAKRHKVMKSSNPVADGYDLSAQVCEWADDVVNNQNMSTTTTDIFQQEQRALLPIINEESRIEHQQQMKQQKSASELNSSESSNGYRTEELFGKYLDLQPNYEYFVQNCKEIILPSSSTTNQENTTKMNGNSNRIETNYQYIDFLEDLSKDAINMVWKESLKLQYRKTYVRFLNDFNLYLINFLNRTVPLLNVFETIIQPANQAFVEEWASSGGYAPGWIAKPVEAELVKNKTNSTSNDNENESTDDNMKLKIDLSKYDTVSALAEAIDGDTLKIELAKLGLKSGGTQLQRAERLFLLKNNSLHELPSKLFVGNQKKLTTMNRNGIPSDTNEKVQTSKDDRTKGVTPTDIHNIHVLFSHQKSSKNEPRVDIARREVIASALLDQVRTILDSTIRRMVRRQTQTLAEREREVDEDLYGVDNASTISSTRKNRSIQNNYYYNANSDDDGSDSNDDDSDEDAPIYNPKNVPLDFDGRPIPYWLFKLHGLNHYYKCEICNNEMYRGRRSFELHFAEQKHGAGMKLLNIPNTKHFHGITSISDAQELWNVIKSKLQNDTFDVSKDEEYEDSHGNVLSRTAFEDLARQGLL